MNILDIVHEEHIRANKEWTENTIVDLCERFLSLYERIGNEWQARILFRETL